MRNEITKTEIERRVYGDAEGRIVKTLRIVETNDVNNAERYSVYAGTDGETYMGSTDSLDRARARMEQTAKFYQEYSYGLERVA